MNTLRSPGARARYALPAKRRLSRMSSTVSLLARDAVCDDPPDRRGDHEAVTAEPGRDMEAVVTWQRSEDRLPVRRDVVGRRSPARRARRTRGSGRRSEIARADVAPPRRRLRLRVTRRAEVAREHTPVVELLRREPPLGRDRRAARAGARGSARSGRGVGARARSAGRHPSGPTSRTRVGSGRDHDGRRGEAAGRRVERPRPAVRDDPRRRVARCGRRVAARSRRSPPGARPCTRPPRSTSLRPASRSGGRAPACPPPSGETTRDGTPAAFWRPNRRARSRSSTASLCATNRYPQASNAKGTGPPSRSPAVVHQARDSIASRQLSVVPHCRRMPPGWMPDCPSATPARSRTTTCAPRVRSARAIDKPTTPAPTTRTSAEERDVAIGVAS